jgi:Arc/MetJ family transcription regulator
MRTTLDLPEDLVESARKALGFKSKTDPVVVALRELVRRHRLEELKTLLGRVELDVDRQGAAGVHAHDRRRYVGVGVRAPD